MLETAQRVSTNKSNKRKSKEIACPPFNGDSELVMEDAKAWTFTKKVEKTTKEINISKKRSRPVDDR